MVCVLKASAVITPGLNLANNPPVTLAKPYKSTVVFTGTLSGCTGTQTNAKAPFDHGTVVAKGKTKYAKGEVQPDCLSLAFPLHPTVLKSTVTFMDASGKTVGKSVATLTVGNLTFGGAPVGATVSFPASGRVSGGAAFKGQTVTVNAVLDGDAPAFGALCVGGASTTFTFTGALGPSRLEIQ